MTVRVVFADDNYLVRQGVTGVLAEHHPDALLTNRRMMAALAFLEATGGPGAPR